MNNDDADGAETAGSGFALGEEPNASDVVSGGFGVIRCVRKSYPVL